MLRLVLASIGNLESGERGKIYHEKGDIRGILRKESSEEFFYVCAYLDRSTYLVPCVAGHPIQDKSVHLTVTTDLLVLLRSHLL